MPPLTSPVPTLDPAIADKTKRLDPDLSRHPPVPISQVGAELVDSVFTTTTARYEPAEVFPVLRWGGQVVFESPNQSATQELAQRYASSGYLLSQGPDHVSKYPWNIRLPFLARKTHYFVARKTHLIPPGQVTNRFTYHVFLEPPDKNPGEPGSGDIGPDLAPPQSEAAGSDGLVVVKQVPSFESVVQRLRDRWKDLPQEIIEKRARKFTEKIFPIFLTREAAILKIVHRDLPESYRARVPRVLDLEKDARGYVRRLHLNWLRNGGEPLGQVEFARQSADLLRVLHDKVGVMHLDLRLDNFVITERGVGFVDFGSAVRDDENLGDNPLLSGLFEELMRTSEIQQMLYSMTQSGQVTSQAISSSLHKVDKAVDFFYLAVQISSPHANPDLKGLIQYHPESDEAKALAKLTARVLRPTDPANPRYKSAADIYHGIERIQQSLA